MFFCVYQNSLPIIVIAYPYTQLYMDIYALVCSHKVVLSLYASFTWGGGLLGTLAFYWQRDDY